MKLDYDVAINMLPESESIHTFRQGGPMLIGADWSREEILDAIKKHGAELSGEQAKKMNHGLVLHDGSSHLFIETKSQEAKP